MQNQLIADHQLLTKSFLIYDEINSACFDIVFREGSCKTNLLEKFGSKHKILAQRRAKGILLKLDAEGIAVISKVKVRNGENSSRLGYYIDNDLEIPEPKSEADRIASYQRNCLSVLSHYFEKTLAIFNGVQEPNSSYSRDIWFRDRSIHAALASNGWMRGYNSSGEGDFWDGDQLYSGVQGYLLKCIRRTEAHLGTSAGRFQP